MTQTTTPASSQRTIEGVVSYNLDHYAIVPSPDGSIKGKDYREAHDLQIATLKAQADALPAITDKVSYDANKSFRNQTLVKARTGIDKFRKSMFEDVRRLKAEVDEYLGTTPDAGLQGRISAIEEAVRAKEQKWEAEQERARQEAMRIIEERTKARVQVLKEARMTFDGSAWTLVVAAHKVELFQTEVRSMNDDRWDAFLAEHVQPLVSMLNDVEARTQRIYDELLSIGMHEDGMTGHLVIACGPDRLHVTKEELDEAIDERVEQLKAEAARIVECERRRKQEQAEEDARRQAEFERQRKAREELDEAIDELEAERKRIAEERAELERQKKEEAERREREDRDAIFKQRFPALQAINECGLRRVGDGEWELHGEQVNWYAIVTATDDGFAAILQRFQQAEERYQEERASTAMAASSGIADEAAGAQTSDDDIVADEGPYTEAELMHMMATALDNHQQEAAQHADRTPNANTKATWIHVSNTLEDLISNLRDTADKDL